MARAWGVDESVAREVRDGAIPIWSERIDMLPAKVRRAFHQAALDDLDDEAPLSVIPLSRHGHIIGRAVGQTHAEIIDAEADGTVDDGERQRVLRAAVVVETSAHALVRELSRGKR